MNWITHVGVLILRGYYRLFLKRRVPIITLHRDNVHLSGWDYLHDLHHTEQRASTSAVLRRENERLRKDLQAVTDALHIYVATDVVDRKTIAAKILEQ